MPDFSKLIFVLFFVFSISLNLNAKQLTIYHDADYSGHATSAVSMAMGLNTALSEVDHKVQGYTLKLVAKDHRGNVKRSKLHMKQFTEDPDALFVLGGLHSPPYLANKNYINDNRIPLLIPWAAAGPITRTDAETNWIFRLSIDDSKAGFRLAQFAVDKKHCKSPHLLLENTGWGKSNFKTITTALKQRNLSENGVTWFEWNTQENEAKQLVHGIKQAKADCIIYVGNAIEGAVFAKALANIPEASNMPVISHWGLTGGNFHELYRRTLHGKIDLSFLQTCFSFNSGDLSTFAQNVFARAKEMYSDQVNKPEDIKAPPGFIHAYDLGQVLLSALNQITLTGNMNEDRAALQQTMENIKQPVKGLVKTYHPPFHPWNAKQIDAHEALGLDDFCMGGYDEQGIIRLK